MNRRDALIAMAAMIAVRGLAPRSSKRHPHVPLLRCLSRDVTVFLLPMVLCCLSLRSRTDRCFKIVESMGSYDTDVATTPLAPRESGVYLRSRDARPDARVMPPAVLAPSPAPSLLRV